MTSQKWTKREIVNVVEQLTNIAQILNVIVDQNKAINHMLVHLSEDVLALKREIKNSNLITTGDLELPALLPKLPMTTHEDFKNFEKILHDNKEAPKQLKVKFLRVGGNSVEEFLRRNLRTTMSDDLVKKFTWTGKSRQTIKSKEDITLEEKPRARSTIFINILKDACFENFPGCNETKMEKTLQQYFLHASDRLRSRMKNLKSSKTLLSSPTHEDSK